MCEVEIRPSLLKWLLLAIVVIVLLARGYDPTRFFQGFLHLP